MYNCHLYFDEKERSSTCSSLITLSAEILGTANIVQHIDEFETFIKRPKSELDSEQREFINSQMFEHIIDLAKIIIFCENYMKAELIIRGYCVNRIKKEIDEFKILAKEQYRRPISIAEIHEKENFIRKSETMVEHRAIKETTIGLKELIGSDTYKKHYEFESKHIEFIKDIVKSRNSLHFVNSLSMSISYDFIKNIKEIDRFSKDIIMRRITQ